MISSQPRTNDEHLVLDPAIVALLPEQGSWSDEDYLWLTNHTNRLVEYTDGWIEVLPMPTQKHQAMSVFLFLALLPIVRRLGGRVFYAPLRLRIRPGKYREPDLLLLRAADDPRMGNEYWDGADLVVEIVSPDDPSRDYVAKRADYAEVGVLEYWIVDPQVATIRVLRLQDDVYVEHGAFARGTTATSALFPEFTVDVDEVLNAN